MKFRQAISALVCERMTICSSRVRLGIVILILSGACNGAGSTPIKDVGPRYAISAGHTASGNPLTVAVGVGGKRLYAGGFAGVWRSDDAGLGWRQMTWTQPAGDSIRTIAGAPTTPVVFDIAVSPQNPDVVFAAASDEFHINHRSALFKSVDGGATWRAAYRPSFQGQASAIGEVRLSPDNPELIYVAAGDRIAFSCDGGGSWRDVTVAAGAQVWHLAPTAQEGYDARRAVPCTTPPQGVTSIRRVYAAGPTGHYVSIDGGQSFVRDSAAPAGGAERPSGSNASGARIIAVDPSSPDRIYFALSSGANGPAFFHDSCSLPGCQQGVACQQRTNTNGTPTRCSEGSLWLADYTNFRRDGGALWRKLPDPPAYYYGSTPSGNVFVTAIASRSDKTHAVIFSDRSHVHVSKGPPAATSSWARLDGRDIATASSQNDLSNRLYVHVDPVAIALSTDFDIELGPAPVVAAPFNQSRVVSGLMGQIWMANHGGVVRGDWNPAGVALGQGPIAWSNGNGLHTLIASNVVALDIPGRSQGATPLFLGTGDNYDFYSIDEGTSWQRLPNSSCGDCSWFFNDPALPDRVLYTDSVASLLHLYRIVGGQLNAIDIPFPPDRSNLDTGPHFYGYRPIIQTLVGEAPPADLDLVVIRTPSGDPPAVWRSNGISSTSNATDWNLRAQLVGPVLPERNINVVQASGGHSNTVLFAGNPQSSAPRVWRLDPGATVWTPLVSLSGGLSRADRFFVSPYLPDVIYVVDGNTVKSYDSRNRTWVVDRSLTSMVTDGNGYRGVTRINTQSDGPLVSIVQDMVFARSEPNTRFAVGIAGVFMTLDGKTWRRLVNATALPGTPIAASFVSRPNGFGSTGRYLYVAWRGRGVTRIGPIPRPAIDRGASTNAR